ncbi:MAG TPA: hypothetical protein VFJ94_15650, partial [Intrasporangium sp.]|uniref:hypothetical protein n=1 Tax=Intrasporangium sp. TaxID=1925024 RepID=UPI002D792B53
GLSDLFAGRYLEAWFPANLPFDPFPLTLDIAITGTRVRHSVISNGDVATRGERRWTVTFPRSFTALSPLLEIRAADTVSRASHTVMLPGSGTAVKIEAWKANGGPEDLGLALDRISTLLRHNERDYGAFHGDRFVCLFPGADGGMEYNQGATTSWRALPHEVFHSWFARGVTPASQSDGWWDEGFTQFHDHGTDAVQPFDFREPPAQLCPRAPFARRTVRNAYTDGSRFFRGLAAALGPAGLRHAMRAVYARYAGRPLSTAQLEAELIAATGRPDLVDAFHRFVYGFADPTPSPRLSLAATPGHAAVWVRHADDGGQAPQAPLTGADNWFHARVRNDAAAGHCRHFAVVFSLTEAAGEEPSYPSGFGTPTTVACDFDLAPGEDRVICARWPRALAPDPGMGLRILAALHYRDGHPTPGTHVWEQPQLAQSHVVGR